MSTSWHAQLKKILIGRLGAKEGEKLASKYKGSFHFNYMDTNSPDVAGMDIRIIETLSPDKRVASSIYSSQEHPEYPIHLRIFQWERSITLSDILPMLENFDLCVNNLRSEVVKHSQGINVWISDFSLAYRNGPINIETVKELFQDAFIQVLTGNAENDDFNKLILGASLSWREATILRAYTKYLRQVGFRFTQVYIERALAAHAEITKELIALFLVRHDPELHNKRDKKTKEIEDHITHLLESVISLDEDRIFQHLLDLSRATVRTNYFQLDANGKNKSYLSFKFNSPAIPDLPLPVPMVEVYIYAPHVEGIHLRNTLVSRGGIRWSDRHEDYRTEILGLMKAQKVKNAVIVPSGAKGGFVAKMLTVNAPRELIQSEIIKCYQCFIRGLLDLTDNLVDGKFISPKDVVCYDDTDPYLVVAADKGTSAFSDIANALSKEYNFWLGDAFASGGSAGYDHKKMGITARGAWESIKRHFRELDIDVLNTDITVVGIGDMSGDVFGNGMLYSKHINLLAAFDHRHIFLDPNPDAKISYAERHRLFNLSTSSWEDYNPALISPGGGVYKRSLKSIVLSPQIKIALDTTKDSMSPNELIRAILKAPVDLFFNGGIGTYVKASTETHADVGDRTNEYCRIDGSELCCRVVAEGGNLGCTQRGRIEYALKGGLINADFIDNSAGVDCSDHEVNLKILLDQEIRVGKLTNKARNGLLSSLTQEIAALVLKDNYAQAFSISFAAQHSNVTIGRHQQYVQVLEKTGTLNRTVEFLPTDNEFLERKNANLGLTRPELAVLLAYTKIQIKSMILDSNLQEDPYLYDIASTAFPPIMQKKYGKILRNHPLFREILATQLSNKIVNEMGFTFTYRMQLETGANIEEIVRAFIAASKIFKAEELSKVVEALGYKVSLDTQYEMYYHIRTVVNLATRWFLHSRHLRKDLGKLIDQFSVRLEDLKDIIPVLMDGQAKLYLSTINESFLSKGLPAELALTIASYRSIHTSLNIIEIATQHKYELNLTAKVYFLIGEKINLLWMRDKIGTDLRQGYWDELARLTLRDELDSAHRALTISTLKQRNKMTDPLEIVNNWLSKNQLSLERWQSLMTKLQNNPNIDYVMFFIAIRELVNVIKRS
ncbi:MAG: NAD-glutamate dehydrogenase [Parachlamydiaceae bacterium]|nr:NAD-glutamate dehydrogenase [Parachlamydiaceae bacterium]